MLDHETYLRERAICDKADAYARATMTKRGPHCNYLTADETEHPDYAACSNAMRGRVEQYEILTNPPERFTAYVGERDGKRVITTWTGDLLGYVTTSPTWKGRQLYATIAGRHYTGRFNGMGMWINLRETAASKRWHTA